MIHLSTDSGPIRLDEEKAVFQGSEGRLFRVNQYPGSLLKVFKTEADYPGSDSDSQRLRKMAEARGRLLFRKLERFPPLPDGVVVPTGMILSEPESVGAIVVPEIEGAVSLEEVRVNHFENYSVSQRAELALQLHGIITALHKLGAVIGDLKPSNVLVKDGRVYVIDVESIAICGCPATGFTWEYADPQWVGSPDDKGDEAEIAQPTKTNDWYSFAVIYFELLTGVGAFSGVHSGKNPIPEQLRMSKKVSVLNSDVILRKKSRSQLELLTASETAYFRRILEGKTRNRFNKKLIESRVEKDAPKTKKKKSKVA